MKWLLTVKDCIELERSNLFDYCAKIEGKIKKN